MLRIILLPNQESLEEIQFLWGSILSWYIRTHFPSYIECLKCYFTWFKGWFSGSNSKSCHVCQMRRDAYYNEAHSNRCPLRIWIKYIGMFHHSSGLNIHMFSRVNVSGVKVFINSPEIRDTGYSSAVIRAIKSVKTHELYDNKNSVRIHIYFQIYILIY